MGDVTKILLIEDNPADSRLMGEMIRDFKSIRVDLHCEEMLKSAMKALQARPFDLIILDLSLPDSTGLSALEHLMRRHSDLPVIIMTGLDDEHTGIEAMRKGAQDYVIKGSIAANSLERIIRYGIERKRSEGELKKALENAECRRREVLALYNGAHSVLHSKNFEIAVRHLFYICKELIGATSGNVAMLSVNDPDHEVVLFQDSASGYCTARPDLPVRIQGLRAEAYRTGKAVFENDFADSQWMQLPPEGQAELENVLYAPLIRNEKAVGLIGLADKPGGFTPEDVYKVSAFGDLAAIALQNTEQSEALLSNLNFVETLLNTLPNPVFYKNSQGEFLGCNNAFAQQILGIPEEEIKGRTVFDFPNIFTPEQAHISQAQDEQLFRAGGVQSFEDTFICGDGKIRDFYFDKTVFYDSGGNINGIVGIMQDITERKKLEKQLLQSQKMEALGTLSGGIAHDFNNILTPILGYTEMLMEDMPEGSVQHSNLHEVYLSAQRAKDLVKQILTFSRQTETRSIPFQIHSIIKEAVKLIQSSLPATIEVTTHIQSRGVITANPTQIHQVVMNLCTNAYQAMRTRGGKLEVSLSDQTVGDDFAAKLHRLKPGEYICLRISDSGGGIAREHLDRIFEPYFTTKKKEEGTGLGLAVVHGIVTACGGAITVKSKIGQGTTFDVFFPKTGQEEILSIEPDGASEYAGSGKILLVDDEPQIIKMTGILLKKMGYEACSHIEWNAALDAFAKDPYSFELVITDMTMPGMTGDRLAEIIMRIRPDIPVIICTGYSELLTREQVRKKGIADLIMKPLSRAELSRAVREAIETHRN